MKGFFRRFRFSMLGVSALCVGIGLLILLRLSTAKAVFCYAFGALLVFSGILQIVSYLINKNKSFFNKVLFVGGIIAMVGGAWILLSPEMVSPLIVIVLGAVLLYHGGKNIHLGLTLHKYAPRSMTASVLLGVVLCGAGVMMLVNPFESESLLYALVGGSFLFDGASGLYTVFAVERGERKRAAHESKAAAVIEAHGETLNIPAPAAGEQVAEELEAEVEPVPAEASEDITQSES